MDGILRQAATRVVCVRVLRKYIYWGGGGYPPLWCLDGTPHPRRRPRSPSRSLSPARPRSRLFFILYEMRSAPTPALAPPAPRRLPAPEPRDSGWYPRPAPSSNGGDHRDHSQRRAGDGGHPPPPTQCRGGLQSAIFLFWDTAIFNHGNIWHCSFQKGSKWWVALYVSSFGVSQISWSAGPTDRSVGDI